MSYVQIIGGQVYLFVGGRQVAEGLASRDVRDAARLAIASAKRENDGEPVSFGLAHSRQEATLLGRNQKKYGVLH